MIKYPYFLIVILCFLSLFGCTKNSSIKNSAVIKNETVLLITGAYQPFRPSVMPMKAGYLTVKNMSRKTVRISDVFSSEYSSVSLHQSVHENGVADMRMLEHIEIAAGQEVTFEPGGLHLMLYQSIKPQQLGDVFTLVFQLDDGTEVPFEMRVTQS